MIQELRETIGRVEVNFDAGPERAAAIDDLTAGIDKLERMAERKAAEAATPSERRFENARGPDQEIDDQSGDAAPPLTDPVTGSPSSPAPDQKEGDDGETGDTPTGHLVDEQEPHQAGPSDG